MSCTACYILRPENQEIFYFVALKYFLNRFSSNDGFKKIIFFSLLDIHITVEDNQRLVLFDRLKEDKLSDVSAVWT